MTADFGDWLRRLHSLLIRRRHRAALVLAGPPDWGQAQAQAAVRELHTPGLWVGESGADSGLDCCSGADARQWLGQDLELLIWDSHAGTHPAGLGAVSGALVGGGLFIWLVPPLESWSQGPDPDFERLRHHAPPYRFLARLARLLAGETTQPHVLLTPDTPLPSLPAPPDEPERPWQGMTPDQQQALTAIKQLATSSDPGPVVLRADRGRGKSAALGMAVASLAGDSGLRIGVTAAQPRALGSVWRFAGDAGHEVLHLPPDELLRQRPALDLLLVDEAATLPVPMLKALMEQWPRIVFATTVHGYEGTGRGFDLRFRAILDEQHPRWRLLAMQTPVRWAENDPLEGLMHRLLCLDADLPELPGILGDIIIEPVPRDALAADEPLLNQIMGLLVSAHYQTSPDDLRQLLDDPDTALWIARSGSNVLGVVWVLFEGGLERELAEAVWLGERRPRGHLMAQSLAFNGGDPEAAQLRYGRITRIAVHPQCRRQGLGLRLVAAAREGVRGSGGDVLGASFGATPQLLAFWQKAGFRLLRLGLRRDAASGTHAAMVGQGLTAAGERLCTEQAQRFAAHWPWLAGGFQRLEPELREQLNSAMPEPQPLQAPLGEADCRELTAFIDGQRDAALTRLPLSRLGEQQGAPAANWSKPDQQLWQRAVYEGQSWDQLRGAGLVQGRRQGQSRLRELAARLWHDRPASGV